MPQYDDINTNLSDITGNYDFTNPDTAGTFSDYDESGEKNLWSQLKGKKSLMSGQMGTGAKKLQESVGAGFSGSGQRQKLKSDMSDDVNDKYGGMLDNAMYDSYNMKKKWSDDTMEQMADLVDEGEATYTGTGDDDDDNDNDGTSGNDDFVPSGYSGNASPGDRYTDEQGLNWIFGGDMQWHSSTGTCFVEGTKIFMSDGSERYIQDIIEGDSILSFDEKTKSFIPGVVTESLIHPVYRDVKVAIVGGILEGTPSHPIFFNGNWSEIKESKADIKIVKKYIDNYFNLEVDAHDIRGSSHNYIANGYIVSGLGDNDVLNDVFKRQKIFQSEEGVSYGL